jgi:hypothetical protein
MITDEALVRRLQREASGVRPSAPVSIDAAVMRAVRNTAPVLPVPRRNVIRFVPALATGLAACLAIAAIIGGMKVKSHYDNLREMQALAADMSDAAAFLARAVKPVTHGIHG